jgi:copper chaperone CopZ
MATAEYNVTGMSCGHCEKSVVEEVSKLAGVTSAEASAATGTLKITSETELAASDVVAAVEEAGYTAQAA